MMARHAVKVVVGGLLLVGMMAALSGLTGCCCPPKKDIVMDQPKAPLPPPAPAPKYEPLPPPPAPLPPPPKKMEEAVEDLNQKYPGLFEYDAARGMLRFNSDMTFDSGSATVKPQARAALTKLATILNEEGKDRALTIVGHTDSVRVGKATTIALLKRLGKTADNQGLSDARAEAVAGILRKGGVNASRMTTMGKGQGEPIADNATPAGKARNRRVEIFLTALSGGSAGGAPAGGKPVTVPAGDSGEVPSGGGGDGMRVIDIPSE